MSTTAKKSANPLLPKERIKVPRQLMPEQPAEVRAHNFEEVNLGYSAELALLYERERQRGNTNRATLAVARKMVAHMLAVDRRKTDFVPEGKLRPTAA